jgi:hypothetical protein
MKLYKNPFVLAVLSVVAATLARPTESLAQG